MLCCVTLQDTGISAHLEWVDTFTKVCGAVLDAVSWHTYDYRSTELGGEDHQPLPYPPPADFQERFWSPVYHDVANRLADNISTIVQRNVPRLAGQIWLTETNSICHQGP